MNRKLNLIYFLFVIISTVFLCQPVCSQVKISGGIGYLVHKSGAPGHEDVYDMWKDKRYQDISHFFEDSYFLEASASYRFSPFNRDTLFAFFAGFEYMQATAKNDKGFKDYIVGKELSIKSYTSFIGGGFIPRLGHRNVFIYLFTGIAIKKFQGTSDYTDLLVKQNYKTGIFPRIGFGIEYMMKNGLPFIFGVEAAMDFGDVTRENVKAYYNGNVVAEYKPTGQQDLPDNSFNFKITAGYLINL